MNQLHHSTSVPCDPKSAEIYRHRVCVEFLACPHFSTSQFSLHQRKPSYCLKQEVKCAVMMSLLWGFHFETKTSLIGAKWNFSWRRWGTKTWGIGLYCCFHKTPALSEFKVHLYWKNILHFFASAVLSALKFIPHRFGVLWQYVSHVFRVMWQVCVHAAKGGNTNHRNSPKNFFQCRYNLILEFH